MVPPDYRSAIAAIIGVRVSQGLSQRELARRLGKHPSFVNKVELLERRLDVLEFIAIARAMEVNLKDLFASVLAALPGDVAV